MLSNLPLRARFLLVLATLVIGVFSAAEYEDLLPYPGMAAGLTGPSPIPVFSQGIIGHVSIGPLTPTCYVNGTGVADEVRLLPTGIISGHGLTLIVPISWKLANCGAEGDFQVTLYPTGLYHFTLGDCTSGTASIGCSNLPVSVNVLPFQMTHITVYVDTGIR
jgi:hypothetical protein